MLIRKTPFPHLGSFSERQGSKTAQQLIEALGAHGAVVISTDEEYTVPWIRASLAVNSCHAMVDQFFTSLSDVSSDGDAESGIVVRRHQWTRAELTEIPNDLLYCPRERVLEYHDRLHAIAQQVLRLLHIVVETDVFAVRGVEITDPERRVHGTLRDPMVEKGFCTVYDHLSVEGLMIGTQRVGYLIPGDVLVHAGARLKPCTNGRVIPRPSSREAQFMRSQGRMNDPSLVGLPRRHIFAQGVCGLPVTR